MGVGLWLCYTSSYAPRAMPAVDRLDLADKSNNRMMQRLLLLYMTLLLGGLSLQAGNKVFETDSLFAGMGPNDKGAILVVHFGTTHDDTRWVTLDAINERIAAAHPELEVRQAYSSRIVRKRLAARGIEIPTPGEALKALASEGFTHLLVVSTTIVDGVEMESLSYEVAHQQSLFKKIRLVTPLLFYESDYKDLVSIMTAHLDPQVAYIWVGHGTYDSATAQYAMLDHYLQRHGYGLVIVGCVEGYPYYEEALERLRATGLKRVSLQPLMIVAGEHAKEDMLQEWQPKLEALGYQVESVVRGLGELPEVQEMILRKVDFFMTHHRLSIMDKKAIYEETGEKLHQSDSIAQ